MNSSNKLSKAIRMALTASLIASPIYTSQVLAQQSAESEENVEKISVTGSRIKRTDIETPVPVTVIGRDQILAIGAINAADVLNQSPVSIAGTDQSNSTFFGASVGLNTTALRNLGSGRTLVLVNGRRFVSGVSPSVGYAVDLNAIPAAMIERIEILKSASSAAYGSDAIAGVVNIITRSDFDGIELNVQSGLSTEGDREKYAFNVMGGKDWGDGSVTIAFGADDDKGLKSLDRDFSEFDEAVLLDENGNEYRGRVFSSFPPQGRVGGYNSDGTAFNGESAPGSDRFNRASYRQLITPLERHYVAFNFNQELSNDVGFFAEANWNSSQTKDSTIEPTPFNTNDVFKPERGGTGGILLSNPMLPTGLVEALMADGYTMDDVIPATVRRMVEFGARSTDVERDTIRIASGLDWDIDGNWSANAYFSWGKTDQFQENGGQVNLQRAAEAFDVVHNENGELQCRSELARLYGCVPLNIWGAGTITPEAVDYVKTPAKSTGKIEQFVTALSIVGETPWELPGGAVSIAAGVEYRLEKGQFQPGDFAQVGASSTNQSAATRGAFHTNDYFVEAIFPVLDNLEIDAAARYSDHSVTDGDTTWNLGAQYSPTEDLKLRFSAARSIRTPNIADLYGGRGETFRTVTDVCDGLQADGSDDIDANIRANCLATPSVASRLAAEGEFVLTQVERQSAGGTIGGNPDVQPEESDSYSAGFIWNIMDGLSMTVDYYDIAIEGAIASTSRSTVLRRCYETSAGQFDHTCGGAVLRGPTGALSQVHSGTSNENDLDIQGIDLELSYRTPLYGGEFGADLIWNHTIEYVQTSIESGDEVDFAGEVLTPDHRANLNLNYAYGDFGFSWRMRYWDSSLDSVDGGNLNFTTGAALTTFNQFGSVVYHDLSVAYNLTDTSDVSLVMRNAFDKEPPFAGQGFANGSTGINTVPEAYDVTGRYMQLNYTVNF